MATIESEKQQVEKELNPTTSTENNQLDLKLGKELAMEYLEIEQIKKATTEYSPVEQIKEFLNANLTDSGGWDKGDNQAFERFIDATAEELHKQGITAKELLLTNLSARSPHPDYNEAAFEVTANVNGTDVHTVNFRSDLSTIPPQGEGSLESLGQTFGKSIASGIQAQQEHF